MTLRIVHAAHDIVEVEISPGAPRRPQKFFAVAGRATGVRVDDEVNVGGGELMLEREVVYVRVMRINVVGEDELARAGRTVAARWDEPGLDHRAVRAEVM